MAGITTHVLDVRTGRPIAGMRVELYDVGATAASSTQKLLRSAETNADGRTDSPMLAADASRVGQFELRFHVGAYFKAADGLSDEVPVRFSVFDAAQHYHVPMLCSPWFFSTYRGS